MQDLRFIFSRYIERLVRSRLFPREMYQFLLAQRFVQEFGDLRTLWAVPQPRTRLQLTSILPEMFTTAPVLPLESTGWQEEDQVSAEISELGQLDPDDADLQATFQGSLLSVFQLPDLFGDFRNQVITTSKDIPAKITPERTCDILPEDLVLINLPFFLPCSRLGDLYVQLRN